MVVKERKESIGKYDRRPNSRVGIKTKKMNYSCLLIFWWRMSSAYVFVRSEKNDSFGTIMLE
jgi:hypothetical protein